MSTETTHIQDHVQYLVNAARIGVRLGGLTPEQALDVVAINAKTEATRARQRTGLWASETTSSAIEEALFAGSVARDILDGTIERPSTGNVRQHALRTLRAAL